MKTLDQISTLLSRAGAIGAGLILVAMTALVVYEVLLRATYGTSTLVAEEMVGFGLGAFTFLGMGYSLQEGSLIRLNMVLNRLPWNVRLWTLVGGMILTLVVSSFLTYAFWLSMAQKFRGGTLSAGYSQIQLWIPEAIVLVGLVIFTLQAIVESLKIIIGQSRELKVSDSVELDLEKEVLL